MIGLIRLLAVFAWCLALPAGGMAAQADQGTFDLHIRGVTAGVLVFTGKNDGKSYSVAGKLESTGIAAMLRRVRYEAGAAGRIGNGRWTPARYEEQADTGKRQSQSRLEYRGGIPREMLKASRAGVPNYVDPATQKGTVDPLTALYALLRAVPPAEACRLKLTMFDGARRSQIALAAAEQGADGVSCAGEYRRIAGFSDKEMAEKTRFAFRVTYGPAEGDPAKAGMVQVVQVTMETLYGRASLTRR